MYDLSSDPSINSAQAIGAAIERQQQARMASLRDTLAAHIAVANPVQQEMKYMNSSIQRQNELLMEQVELLRQENELQKEQLVAAECAEAEAKKAARHSKIFGWVSFGVATAISIAALIVSIIAIL